MSLKVHITSFGNDPYFDRGYTEIVKDIDDTIALFPLNDGETQADVDARVRKYLAADEMLEMLRKIYNDSEPLFDVDDDSSYFEVSTVSGKEIYDLIRKAKGETE